MKTIIFILSLFFSVHAMAFNPSDMRAFGKSAPVQMYLFTSLTCSHCADFHKKILPDLKKEYADSGKAQIIVVDMVTGNNGLTATQAVRCLDVGKADKLEDDLYANQSKWAFKGTSEAKKIIASYAVRQGMTDKMFDTCISDQDLQRNIIEQQANLARLYGITGTPTLVMRDGSEVRKWSGANKKIFKELKEAFQK